MWSWLLTQTISFHYSVTTVHFRNNLVQNHILRLIGLNDLISAIPGSAKSKQKCPLVQLWAATGAAETWSPSGLMSVRISPIQLMKRPVLEQRDKSCESVVRLSCWVLFTSCLCYLHLFRSSMVTWGSYRREGAEQLCTAQKRKKIGHLITNCMHEIGNYFSLVNYQIPSNFIIENSEEKVLLYTYAIIRSYECLMNMEYTWWCKKVSVV